MQIQETGPQSPTYLGLAQKFIEYHINDKIQFNVHKPDDLNDDVRKAAEDAKCLGEIDDASMVVCIDFVSENSGGQATPDQNVDQGADQAQPAADQQAAPADTGDAVTPTDDTSTQDQAGADAAGADAAGTETTQDQAGADAAGADAAGDQTQDDQVQEADDGSGGSQPQSSDELRLSIKKAIGKYFGVNDTNVIDFHNITMPDGSKAGFITIKYATGNDIKTDQT